MNIEAESRYHIYQYIAALVSLRIKLQQHLVKFSRTFQVIVMILSLTQCTVFIVRPTFNSSNQVRDHNNLLSYSMYFVRLDLFIIDYMPYYNYQYYFLIPLGVLILFEIFILFSSTIYLMHQTVSVMQPLKVQLENKGLFISLCLQGYSIYAQLLQSYFKLPFYMLLVEQIKMCNQLSDQVFLSIGILVLLFFFLVDLFSKIIYQESDSLMVTGFETLNLSVSDFIIELLMIAQIMIYCVSDASYVVSNVQASLIITISVVRLFQVLVQKKYPITAHVQTIIFTQSIILVYMICWLFNYTNIVLLLVSLLVFVFQSYIQRNNQRNIIQFEFITDNKVIKFYTAQFINEQFDQEQPIMAIQQAIFLANHKQSCTDATCYCQLDIRYKEAPRSLQVIQTKQINQIILNKMRLINSTANSKGSKKNSSDLLHYASTLYQLGYPIIAFQYCMQILSARRNSLRNALIVERHNKKQEIYIKNDSSNNKSVQNSLSVDERLQSNSEKNLQKPEKVQLSADSISWLTTLKIEQLMYKIKYKLNISLALSSDIKKESLSYSMQLFLDNEQTNESIRNFIIKVIQNKIEFYQFMLLATSHQSQKIFDKFKSLGQMALELDRRVSKQYESFPSIKYQSIICFFQAEVMNNLFEASKYATLTAMSEEKLMDMQSSINLFSKHVNYMILNLDQSLTQLQIQMHSNNLHIFFGYKYDFFKKQKTIDFILPQAINYEHGILIQRFIQTGVSKYFRNQNISFYRQSNQFIKAVKLLVDINYYQIENISFAAFIEPVDTDSAYILVDVNNVVGGISQSLLEKIGFTRSEIIQYGPELIQMYRCEIDHIIPGFQSIKQNKPVATINLVKLIYMKDNSLSTNTLSKQKTPWWSKQTNYQTYNVSIQVMSNQLYGFEYHVIEINDVIIEKTQLQVTAAQNYSESESSRGEQQLVSLTPVQTIANISNIEVSIEEGVIGQPKENFVRHKYSHQQQSQYQGQDIYSALNSPNQEQNQDQVQDIYGLNSPNFSISKLIETSKNIQQKFFNNDFKETINKSMSGQVQNNIEESPQVQDFNPEEQIKIKINQQLRQMNNKNSKPFDDLESTASVTIRKSVFFNKYDLITKTTNKIAMPESLLVTYFTIILFAVVSIIFYILVLSQNTADMQRFIDETQLLQVHSGFMAPLDSYQSFIVQIYQYQKMYSIGIGITNLTEFGTYNNWLIERIWKGYSDMQTSFVQQFTNPYTIKFYIDNSLNVLYQDSGYKLQQKNMSFQESLHQMLEYQFMLRGQFQAFNLNSLLQQLTAYCIQIYGTSGIKNPTQTQLNTCFKAVVAQSNSSNSFGSTPASIYFQANYFDFHNKFQKLSDTILAYSLNRKSSVESKWIWTWIPFIAVCLIILLISCYSYQLYIKYYERFIDLHKHLDNNSLQREIDKYKIMVAILLKDSNILFRYHFDLESKEQQILEQKTVKEQLNMQQPLKLQQRRNRQSSNASLSSTLSFLGFFSFIVIFMIFSIIIYVYNSQYLDQYAKTASFYVTLSDITYILPGLYFQRYLAYTISQYPYYNQSDINDLYSRINFGLETISSFQNFLINYDSNLFLSSDYFNTQLTNMNSHGVCDFLPPTIQAQVTFYCPQAFQGALTQGYFQSLNYIYHSLENEKSINNFNKQTTYNLFEVEGAYILMRATQVLQSSLFQSISQRTNDSINITLEISIIYIVLMVLIVVFLFYFIVGYYENEFFVVRRSILLLPTQTLFLDDVFERSLRFISLKDGN